MIDHWQLIIITTINRELNIDNEHLGQRAYVHFIVFRNRLFRIWFKLTFTYYSTIDILYWYMHFNLYELGFSAEIWPSPWNKWPQNYNIFYENEREVDWSVLIMSWLYKNVAILIAIKLVDFYLTFFNETNITLFLDNTFIL